MNILEVRNMSHSFGGLVAIRDLSFNVKQGSIQALIGPNGSGKSTAFDIIAGSILARSGQIEFESHPIMGLKPVELVCRGLCRTFQATQIFEDFTVQENLEVSAQVTARMSLWRSYLNTSKFDVLHSSVRRRVGELIERLDLRAVSRKQGRDLTYRDQKMLAIANALATNPKLLLLDEPMAGLTSKETQEAMEVIRWSRDQGVTVLLIEHDMRCVMELCERIVVLNHGEKICEGTPAEVRNSERVIETYLGAD